MQDAVAREEAVKQWSANPCGGVGGDETSLDYFLEVERSRYEQQPWQHARFRFEQYTDRRVLEIGVGLGTDLVQFAKAGAVCHGIDITDRHLELAARNFALRGLPVTLKKSDAARIEYPDGYFDVVYSFGVIHHIPDAAAVLREIHRVLKPGGRCLISLYHKHSLFHLYMVLVRGVFRGGRPRRYEGLMATIDADGVSLRPTSRSQPARGEGPARGEFQAGRSPFTRSSCWTLPRLARPVRARFLDFSGVSKAVPMACRSSPTSRSTAGARRGPCSPGSGP